MLNEFSNEKVRDDEERLGRYVLGEDVSGRDGVDADLVWCQFDRQAPCHLQHRAFASIICDEKLSLDVNNPNIKIEKLNKINNHKSVGRFDNVQCQNEIGWRR